MNAALQIAPPRATCVIPLTADLCARALIAAARAYGVDPVLAATCSMKTGKGTARIAAADAMALVMDLQLKQTSRVFGVAANSAHQARQRGGSYFLGRDAAARAIRFANWKPEAAATVVGGQAPEPIELRNPPGETIRSVEGGASAAVAVTGEPPVATVAPISTAASQIEGRVGTVRPTGLTLAAMPRILERRASAPVHLPPAAAVEAPTSGARRAPPGAISSYIAPSLGVPSGLPKAERPLADQITEVLQDGSATPMGLASLLGAKEALVQQSLSGLKHNGLVEAGPMPPEGIRHQRWALAGRAVA